MWFAFYNGYSGQTLYDEWLIVLYNVIFTGLPPLFLGMFEKDVNEGIIDDNPRLYRRHQSSPDFSLSTFAKWMAEGVLQSLVIFFFAQALVRDMPSLSASGTNDGLVVMGAYAAIICVIVVNCRIGLLTRYWTWIVHFGIWVRLARCARARPDARRVQGSIIVFLAFLFPYSTIIGVSLNFSFVGAYCTSRARARARASVCAHAGERLQCTSSGKRTSTCTWC